VVVKPAPKAIKKISVPGPVFGIVPAEVGEVTVEDAFGAD
jgi:hypothetical protein